ncbi:asparagine synthase C-terminal domain-containing protein [Georgenia satyanarayanai]|uniref:asparagine synthase-related protein n=1 Tax=Georgenia satyanarayanai TaxID=860221 RepID=UPI0020401E5D|nr:asparagine synthase C-terminal domain-containing protein [Georgenia satyanarayanai]MCM3660786.1 asparagine synthase C-terminal domain-containing protein [Georgenia satyanarayanai]
MSAPTAQATFTSLTRAETLLALPEASTVPVVVEHTGLGARATLEAILLDALSTPPCHVLFSGGRDSSALLALTVRLARRHGLAEPVAVTVRHPAAPESDETAWQELVLEHLDLHDHLVLDFDGEQRLLGEVATAALRRHGPVWPEAVQLHGAVYRHLDPGVVISGEGGDAVLDGQRMGAVRDALALTRPRRRYLRHGLRAARPNVLRRRDVRAQAASISPPWLRPAAAAEYLTRVTTLAQEPLRWDRATREALRSRPMAVAMANVDAGIAEYGSRPVTPFADLRFVDALAAEAGPLGWGDRTAIFRRLFHDVLPDRVLSRRSKASFNSTRWGPEERAFARAWEGAGLDPDWVDPAALRAAWLEEDPHPAADFLLHLAWAQAHGIPTAVEHAP